LPEKTDSLEAVGHVVFLVSDVIVLHPVTDFRGFNTVSEF